jgi:predicted aspartyl protease
MAVIEGFIDEQRQGWLPIKVRGMFGVIETSAIVDTGFNGDLVIPVSIAVPLGLILVRVERFELADGAVRDHFVFHGWAQIADLPEVPTEVIVTLSGDPLIGMELLESWDATVSFNLPQRKVIVSTP